MPVVPGNRTEQFHPSNHFGKPFINNLRIENSVPPISLSLSLLVHLKKSNFTNVSTSTTNLAANAQSRAGWVFSYAANSGQAN